MEEIIKGWAHAELCQWASSGRIAGDLSHRFDELNRHFQSVFLFDIKSDGVVARTKDGLYLSGQPKGSSHGFVRRVELYLDFFNRLLPKHVGSAFTIAVDMEDLCNDWTRTPVFSFQKVSESTNILLPDVDFLAFDFYREESLFGLDSEPLYAGKRPEAIFTGSTTGVGTITAEKLDRNQVPRVRAARFFKNHPSVHFSLPGIVQCQDESIVQRLRGEELGTDRRSWRDQLDYRFLISIDGNGATCSRIYIALKSLGVLLKYRSPHLLYYFRGLQQNVHYVDIAHEQDVLNAITIERQYDEFYKPVAMAGREFAIEYLSPKAVEQYTLELFGLYSRLATSR